MKRFYIDAAGSIFSSDELNSKYQEAKKNMSVALSGVLSPSGGRKYRTKRNCSSISPHSDNGQTLRRCSYGHGRKKRLPHRAGKA